MTHICVSKLTIIASDNGLSPGRRQAIIRTNAGILLIEPLWKNFSEISIEIHTFSFKEMHLKMSSGKWRPFCLGLNLLSPKLNAGLAERVLQIKWYFPGIIQRLSHKKVTASAFLTLYMLNFLAKTYICIYHFYHSFLHTDVTQAVEI